MPITVPVTGDQISATSFGAPVANEVNRLTPLVDAGLATAWVNVPFDSKWTSSGQWGYPAVSVRKMGGMVWMRGLAQAQAIIPANSVSATIPVGYRPLAQIMAMTPLQIGAPTSMYRCEFALDGTMRFASELPATTVAGFDQIFWPA